jgi:endogenous inhibitor of DNA gyrase (YacG/DUF329 family)
MWFCSDECSKITVEVLAKEKETLEILESLKEEDEINS